MPPGFFLDFRNAPDRIIFWITPLTLHHRWDRETGMREARPSAGVRPRRERRLLLPLHMDRRDESRHEMEVAGKYVAGLMDSEIPGGKAGSRSSLKRLSGLKLQQGDRTAIRLRDRHGI